MKRLALFFFFDEWGYVDKYVVFMLKDLRKNVERILVVVNGKIDNKGKEIFSSVTDDLLIRENKGYDVWAYKEGIEYIGYESLKKYDEFIMMNYTNFGPIFPFQEMFSKMEANLLLDFWGLSMSWGNKKDIPEHIQSHFIVVRKKVLESIYFKMYWDNVPQIKCYEDALYKHEFVFTKYFVARGFRWDVYLHINEYENVIANPLLAYPYLMLKEKRTPLIKRKSFFLNPDWLFNIGLKNNIVQMLQFIDKETDYDISLIWENLLRTQNLRMLQWSMGLDFIVSDSSMLETTISAMVLFDLYHIYDYKRYKEYLDILPKTMGIFFRMLCSYQEEMLEKIENYFDRKIEFIDASYNAFQIISEKYEVVFLVNNKEGKYVLTDAFNLYDKKNFDNIFSSKNVICQLKHYMQVRKEIGGLFSDISCNRELFDSIWKNNYPNIIRLFEEKNINVKIERDSPPIYCQSGICVLRTKFLKEYFILNEVMLKRDIDSSLVWIILSIIMQSQGYASGHFYNEKFVTDVLSYNEYYYFKMQEKLKGQNIYELKHFNMREMILLNLKYCKEKKEMLKKWIKRLAYIGNGE